MVVHTLVFDEGVWAVAGRWRTAAGETEALAGDLRVVHWPGVWLLEGKLTGDASGSPEVELSAELAPVEDDADRTSFTAFNSALGRQLGDVLIVDDGMLCSFEARDAGPRGAVYFHRVDDDTYAAIGTVHEGTTARASFSVTLERRKG